MSLLQKVNERKAAKKGNGERLRVRKPVVLTGIGPAKRVLIEPKSFHLLDVDLRYQRDRINIEVGDLVEAIRQGGLVPDPITVCMRTFKENGKISPKYWIIDGQQRAWAYLMLDRAFWADVHSSDSLDAEREFFIVMNQRVGISARQMVESWSGPSAVLLRKVAATSGHPLAGRVSFRQTGGPMAASSLIRGMHAAMCGVPSNGRIDQILQRCDAAMVSSKRAVERAESYLAIIRDVFPNGYAKTLPLTTIGVVAHRRWKDRIDLPSRLIRSKMRRINWDEHAPSPSIKWLPVVLPVVERAWK